MSVKIAGKAVGPIGFGLMNLTLRQPPMPYESAFAVMRKALEEGATFWNAGDFYGPTEASSLQLLKAYFAKYPEDRSKIVISVKSCTDFPNFTGKSDAVSVRKYLDRCLDIIDGAFFIDVVMSARIRPETPVEETIGAIAEYVKAGKIGGIGISEVDGATIERAVKVHPIATVENELSLFTTESFHNGAIAACKKNNITFVAYSPLSRGFLTGAIRRYEDMPEDDTRRHYPRYHPDNFDNNIRLVERVEQVAKSHGYTLPQVAIGWVSELTHQPDMPAIIPIPGATKVAQAQENTKKVSLTQQEVDDINGVLKQIEGQVVGGRYPGH